MELTKAWAINGRTPGSYWLCAATIAIGGVVCGCVSPSMSLPGLGNVSDPAKSKNSSVERTSYSGHPTATQLAINGVIIEADEIWIGKHDQLQRKRAVLAPGAYERFLVEESAAIIRGKIADTLLYSRATQDHMPEISEKIDAFVDTEIRKIVSTKFDGVQRRYERQLKENGQTLESARSMLRREVVIAGFLDGEIKPKLTQPTRDDLWHMFQENSATWSRPPRRSMSLIDVRVLDQLDDETNSPTREQLAQAREKARARITSAQQSLFNGADFASVAKEFSDGSSAADGGQWGWVSRGAVRKRFEPAVEALYSLEAGEVSDIIESDDGFFLVRCDESDPGRVPDFQTAQPELLDQYQRKSYDQLVRTLIGELRDEARIEPSDLSIFHRAVVASALNGTARRGG